MIGIGQPPLGQHPHLFITLHFPLGTSMTSMQFTESSPFKDEGPGAATIHLGAQPDKKGEKKGWTCRSASNLDRQPLGTFRIDVERVLGSPIPDGTQPGPQVPDLKQVVHGKFHAECPPDTEAQWVQEGKGTVTVDGEF
jgi:hypothetical protein